MLYPKFNTRIFLGILLACSTQSTLAYEAPHASIAPVIDGLAEDQAWTHAKWEAIDELILGEQPSVEDFSGRFKVVWTENKIFFLGEIVDDILIDTHADPLEQYWDDDAFEIFFDENKSGGDHLNSHNAFAYHLSLDNQAIDYSTQGKPIALNDHVTSVWRRDSSKPNKIFWEASFDIYPDTFKDIDNQSKPVKLTAGKELGFMVSYCDSDSTNGREHFIGSHPIEAVNGDKNRGYIDASVFDSLTLVK
jgi:hypothetical protein